MSFKDLANLPPMTELQKLNYQAGFLRRQIERLNEFTPYYEKGIYGTSAACASEARFSISILEKELAFLEEKISQLS